MKRVVTFFLFLALAGCSGLKTRDDLKEGGKASSPSGGDTISTGDDSTSEPTAASQQPVPGEAAAPAFAGNGDKKTNGKQLGSLMDEAMKHQDYEGLQRAAINALSQNPSDARALAALGVVNYQRKKYLAALYFFNKSLAQSPNASDVHNNIGLVQLALKERKEAIKAFKKAFEANPNDGAAAANLGSIYASEGDYVKALNPLDHAVKAGIKDGRVYNNYGIALTAAGKYEEAKSIYEEAIRMNSGFRDAIYNYAILLIDHLNQNQAGLDALNKLRFLGLGEGMRDRINSLETKAKAGLK